MAEIIKYPRIKSVLVVTVNNFSNEIQWQLWKNMHFLQLCHNQDLSIDWRALHYILIVRSSSGSRGCCTRDPLVRLELGTSVVVATVVVVVVLVVVVVSVVEGVVTRGGGVPARYTVSAGPGFHGGIVIPYKTSHCFKQYWQTMLWDLLLLVFSCTKVEKYNFFHYY